MLDVPALPIRLVDYVTDVCHLLSRRDQHRREDEVIVVVVDEEHTYDIIRHHDPRIEAKLRCATVNVAGRLAGES